MGRWNAAMFGLLVALASPGVLAEEPRTLAVLEFADQAGLSQYEIEALSDEVREAALVLGREGLRVMTRESMLVMLPPGTTLAECQGAQCEVEMGRKVGADLVVAGTVGRFAGQLEVRLKAFDTRTAALLGACSASGADLAEIRRRMRAEAEALFRRILSGTVSGGGTRGGEAEVETLIARPEAPRGVSVEDEGTGLLFVQTEPPKATVFLDGRDLGPAPVQVEAPVGRRTLRAEMGRLWHPAVQAVDLTPRGAKVTLRLAPAHGTLVVESDPPGAEVFLDGEPVGRTPWQDPRRASGEYRVRVVLEGYLPREDRVRVEDGGMARHAVRLGRNQGALDVQSDPPGAAIHVNDRPTGRVTPAVIPEVPAGPALVRATLPGHRDAVEKVEVVRDQTREVRLRLEPRLAVLTVTSRDPSGTPCSGTLRIGGREVGETPWRGEVTATVRQEIEVQCGDLSGKTEVTLAEGAREAVEVVAGPRTGRLSVRTVDSEGRPCRGSVAIDGRSLGESPWTGEVVAAVPHRVEAACGDEKGAADALVPKGGEASVEVRMRPGPPVRFPVTLGVSEGFLRADDRTLRTKVGIDLSAGLAFRKASWIRIETELGWMVEDPMSVHLRLALQWYFGTFPMYLRTGISGLVHPLRRAGFWFGLGGDVPLPRRWYLRLAMEPTVFSASLVPVEFRLGVGRLF